MNWKVLPVESGQIADTETSTVMLPAAALVLEVARLASAAERIAESVGVIVAALEFDGHNAGMARTLERIAAALEAGRDDPDAYEYGSCWEHQIDARRAEGWQVLGMSIETGSIALRRPRQQE